MGIRTGTVGYSYRDWAGIFYPQGTPPRRQFNIYAQNFDVCELTQFSHQMPDPERMTHFAAQIRTDLELFVRLHNTFTHCADAGLALTIAKHFRKAMEPLADSGKLAGLVAAFPYAFKNTKDNREYIQQLAGALDFGEQMPLQLDFRHGSWATSGAIEWAQDYGLGIVCVDEPQLPGLVSPLVVATAARVLVRLHGRNADSWWSGNAATRYDYSYSDAELGELRERYAPLLESRKKVSFLFHNNWQAQSVQNALRWKQLLGSPTDSPDSFDELTPLMPFPKPAQEPTKTPSSLPFDASEDDALRPPTSLPLSEVKSRVTRALSIFQESFELPLREE